MNMRNHMRLAAAAIATLFALAGLAHGTVITDFSAGDEDWSVSGRDNISPTGGNPGANMDVDVLDVFGADIRNTANPAFQGDYTTKGPIRLTVDIWVDSINFFGSEVSRELIVELRDNTPSSAGYPYVSVWYSLGVIKKPEKPGWSTYSVDLLDPTSPTLPAGWRGYGDEDPVTFEPILPADRTFDSVLASVDELHFTTFVPGFFFGFTNFEIAVDNVGYISIPEPTSGLLASLLAGGLLLLRRR